MSTTQQPDELHRQHARIEELEDVADMAIKRIAELEAQLSAIGAGGVEPLRKQAAPAALAVPMAEAWEQSAADTEHQRTGAGLHFNQGIAEGLRICAKDLRAALAAPAHPAEGVPAQAVELEVDDLIDRLLDAQQDLNLAANIHMDQSIASASTLLDEVEIALRTLAATQPAAHGMEQDAARYRFLRDGDWRENDDVAPFVHLQLNALWDEKIDAALTAQAKQGGAA